MKRQDRKSPEHHQLKADMLLGLEKKWGKIGCADIKLWNKYQFKLKDHRLELDLKQPPNRKQVGVDLMEWQAVVQSAKEAYQNYDPEYGTFQQRFDKAAQSGDTAYRKHFKKLALLDAKYRRSPDWMNERSFTDAVRMAFRDEDGDFFIKLGRILKKPPERGIQYDKLALLLLDNYASGAPPDGVFLAIFSDTALAALAGIVIGRRCGELALKKTRQRLNLEKLPNSLIRHVKVKNGIILATA